MPLSDCPPCEPCPSSTDDYYAFPPRPFQNFHQCRRVLEGGAAIGVRETTIDVRLKVTIEMTRRNGLARPRPPSELPGRRPFTARPASTAARVSAVGSQTYAPGRLRNPKGGGLVGVGGITRELGLRDGVAERMGSRLVAVSMEASSRERLAGWPQETLMGRIVLRLSTDDGVSKCSRAEISLVTAGMTIAGVW